jgi:DME family drug/metabolite transporter
VSAGARSDRVIGYLEVLGAASLWGSSGVFSVHLFEMGLSPESVAVLRPILGLAFLLAFFVARPAQLLVSRHAFLLLAGVGGFFTALFQLADQLGIAGAGVPTTVALVYLAPAFVVAASGPILREWPTRARVVLAVVSVAGVWMTVLGARGAHAEVTSIGVLWGVVAGASYAGYTLFGRYAVPRFGSPATAIHSAVGACLLLVGFSATGGADIDVPPDGRAWAVLSVFALLTIAIATVLFFDGLGRIQASRAAIVSTIEPVVAALLATILVGQGLTLVGWLGLGLVVVGVTGSYASDGAHQQADGETG